MKKILLGALLLLSIATYSQDSFLDKIGNGNGHGHNDDNDDDDEDNDDPQAPITDYLYILGLAGIVYAGNF
jgi:hypothetical protein